MSRASSRAARCSRRAVRTARRVLASLTMLLAAGDGHADDATVAEALALDPAVIERFWLTPNAGASEREIAAAEARLGATLPSTLRALYRLSNGGEPNLAETEEDLLVWGAAVRAFPSGMVAALDELASLAAINAEMAVGDWPFWSALPEGADRMIALSWTDRYAITLDMRDGDGDEAGVAILFLGGAEEARARKTYPSFDAFLLDATN